MVGRSFRMRDRRVHSCRTGGEKSITDALHVAECPAMTNADTIQFETNACDQCYRTKQTCTKHTPQCRRCAGSSTPCTYSFGKFKGKPKKKGKGRPAAPSVSRDQGERTMIQAHDPDQTIDVSIPQETLSDAVYRIEGTVQTAVARSSPSSADGSDGNRKRQSKLSACDQCYRFKVKCIRTGDSCQRCLGNKSACTFSFASASEENDISRLPGGAGTKRRRQSDSEPQPAKRSAQAIEFIGSREDNYEISAGEGHMLSLFEEPLPPLGNSNFFAPISLDISDQLNRISSERIVQLPPSDLRPIYDVSSTKGTSLDGPTQRWQEMFTQADQGPGDGIAHTASHSTKCSCLVSILSALSKLHKLGLPMTPEEGALDLNSVIPTICNALATCEKVSDCQACTGPTRVLLCLKMMQQITMSYEALHPDRGCDHSSARMSIQVGGAEFSGAAYAPAIVEAILSVQKKNASRVCDKLLSICAADQEGDEEKQDSGARLWLTLLKQKL